MVRSGRRTLGRSIRHALEGTLFAAALGVFRLLPFEAASAAGGRIGRTVGPLLKRDRIARSNLRTVMPELTDAERDGIAARMWDNIGRNLGEFAHLDRIYPAGRVEIEGGEHIAELLDRGAGAIFFSAHYGNWELLSISLARQGLAPVCVYRPASSPLIERLIQNRRLAAHGASGVDYVPKTARGLRDTVRALRDGRPVAMLIDQKMNQGVPVPFFGRMAMTAPAIAQIALKYDVPVVPARVDRLGDARFRVTAFPPLEIRTTGEPAADSLAILTEINRIVEEWVRAAPGQWLWAHRRWPSKPRTAAPDQRPAAQKG